MPTTQTKPFYKSKTIIINTVLLILGILAMPEINYLHINQQYIEGAALVLNIILRFYTDKPISLSGDNRP